MHEMSIANSVVEICEEQARGAQVLRVRLEIGQLAAVLPDALRFCFPICAEGTMLEGADLVIIETPGTGRCADCGNEVLMTALFGQCGCGSVNLDVLSGTELKIKDMEVAQCV